MNRSAKTERWAVCLLMTLTAAIYIGSAGIPTNAFTARAPTALAVTALVLVTYKIGRLLFGFRAGLFGGLALATSVGMFLFTRIILPDALFALILSLLIYSFLRWEQAERKTGPLLWMYVFAGLAVLAKGLISVAFPAGIIVMALMATGRWKDAARLISFKGILLFLAIATPWHILIGMRNPGFFRFYFINEHLLRFLGGRYPTDYGTVPLVPFWLLHAVWLFPWSAWLLALCWPPNFRRALAERGRGFVLLLAGAQFESFQERGARWPGIALACGVGLLTGITLIVLALFITSHGAVSFLHLRDNPDLYAFYPGHLFDLTPESLLALRAPLLVAALGLAIILPLHHLVERPEAKAAVLSLGMAVFFVAANMGLKR